MSAFLVRIFAALALLALASVAQAGSWNRLDPANGDDCSLLFEGPIEKGDLTYAIDAGLLDGFATRLCLNSPGGALGEVLAFLKASETRPDPFFFGTRIRSGEECLSSCAILFMFGQAFGANSPYPSRQIEPGARLGFHSPFIADGTARAASDAEVFRVALQISKLLADRSYKAVTTSGPALPQELLALVLRTPSGDMRYVDTIGELRLLLLEPTRDLESEAVLPDRRDALERLLKRICITSHTLTFRHHMVEDGYEFADLVQRATDPAHFNDDYEIHALERDPAEGYQPEKLRAMLTGPGYFQPGWYSAGSMMYCRVEMSLERRPDGLRITGYFVDFDFVNSVAGELARIPEPTYSFEVVAGGLLPLDTPY